MCPKVLGYCQALCPFRRKWTQANTKVTFHHHHHHLLIKQHQQHCSFHHYIKSKITWILNFFFFFFFSGIPLPPATSLNVFISTDWPWHANQCWNNNLLHLISMKFFVRYLRSRSVFWSHDNKGKNIQDSLPSRNLPLFHHFYQTHTL